MNDTSPVWSIAVLPDSKGCIEKLLYHHSPVRQQGNIIHEGIFGNFLKALNRTGVKPRIYVIGTYADNEEKESLIKEADTWKHMVKHWEYTDVQITRKFLERPPYAQDICIVLDSQEPHVIITKSSRVLHFRQFLSKAEELVAGAGLRIAKLEGKFHLEGGYVYATSNHLFYSDPADRQIVETFKQEPFFINDLISDISEKALEVLTKTVGTIIQLPAHVDLLLSFLERDNSCDVFHVDLREGTLSNPLLTYRQYILLKNRFDEWDRRMTKLLGKIDSRLKKPHFHKMPGVIRFESFPYSQHGLRGTAVLPYVYSGVNLLFHSVNNKDYAFYLKYPKEIEEEEGLEINGEIESVLKSQDINAIPISGDFEITNFIHIQNSAGLRCLVKPLTRCVRT